MKKNAYQRLRLGSMLVPTSRRAIFSWAIVTDVRHSFCSIAYMKRSGGLVVEHGCSQYWPLTTSGWTLLAQ